MKKLSKKALEDAIKNDCLLSSDLLSVSKVRVGNMEDKYYITCKEYQAVVYSSSYGVGGWFTGQLNFVRLNRLLELLKEFDA